MSNERWKQSYIIIDLNHAKDIISYHTKQTPCEIPNDFEKGFWYISETEVRGVMLCRPKKIGVDDIENLIKNELTNKGFDVLEIKLIELENEYVPNSVEYRVYVRDEDV